jgi:D-alanine-D-alanine ligase
LKIKLGVFFGGRSVEHEVSVITGIQTINNLDKSKYDVIPIYISRENSFYTGERIGNIEEYRDIKALIKKSVRIIPVSGSGRCELIRYPLKRLGSSVYDYIDIAFPAVHGTNTEDGTIQGFFRTLDIPFVGSDILPSAAGMDKYAMKTLFRDAGLPVLDAYRFNSKEYYKSPGNIVQTLEEKLRYPMIVKPGNLGSSVGIKIARDRGGLGDAIDYAAGFARTILVENAVENLMEINCAVLGDYENARASECEQPLSFDEILSYEDKYVSGGKSTGKGMGGLRRIIPAPIDDGVREDIRSLAIRAFKALDCSGVARVDFLMDKLSGEVWVNEINTIPGSLAYYLWEPLGMKYSQLLDEMISLAMKRQREDSEINYEIETGILAGFSGGGSKGVKL